MFEQDRFMVRLRQRVLSDSSIVAAWLAGSFGRNTPDPYSDIDIALVFANSVERDAAWQKRTSFTTDIMAYVPAKSIDNPKDPESHMALYGNGTLVDFRYLNAETVTPHWLDGEIKILKDNVDQLAERQLMASRGLRKGVQRVNSAELTALDNQFWVLFWDAYRRARRGTPAGGVEDYLQLVSLVLPTLFGALPKQSPTRSALIDVQYSLGADTTLAHLRALVVNYRAARSEIVVQNRIDFRPNDAFEREIDRALNK